MVMDLDTNNWFTKEVKPTYDLPFMRMFIHANAFWGLSSYEDIIKKQPNLWKLRHDSQNLISWEDLLKFKRASTIDVYIESDYHLRVFEKKKREYSEFGEKSQEMSCLRFIKSPLKEKTPWTLCDFNDLIFVKKPENFKS